MSIDQLQNKIRKLKNPSVIDFGIKDDCLPEHLLREDGSFVNAYGRFCRELLDALQDTIPAVRFPFDAFALMGNEGITLLQNLLTQAKELGYYVMLDGPGVLSPWAADRTANAIFEKETFPCDGIILSPYIGSDCLKPFLPYCKDNEKAVFLVVRSPNKSASELQDLLTGTRHVYNAAAELSSRFGEMLVGKSGYSHIAAVANAGSADIIRTLRAKHNRTFLLVDGLDYPSGNAKNCSYAFDRFGHGAAVSAGPSVTAAWKDQESDGKDYLSDALQAAERMRKNLTRYITIL